MAYTLYYHPDCADCAKQARTTKRLDWINRIALSTDTPPSGPLVKGEIALISNQGRLFTGGYATRRICLNIPLYFVLGLLLYIPPLFSLVNKEKVGCNGDSCEI